ncbi:DUF1402 family protein [Agrobacterium rubi]|uniref:DUF1402 family protein n=1 Tax=Agrobacterium rubi TaxID=28099 RepID=A0AAE7R140_9HYPH|nr:DUF1402 family protein [Agrobacterium rubi]NTE87513.1 DUF1402 family protein [Agrobacterium rubi]NTF03367.1 DUF1402 family protein [Agrobacterium rubi]NTF37527.1 DUF1402 family protein [Agrobacterium rubi]OCJ45808.1 hypothetical protein A6U92_15650 [Agrobacterium rubi]QTG00303.1 DUF1402 family protein [Agrobacterium rubi]
MRKTLLALAAVVAFGAVSQSFAEAASVVPPGNRNAEQPGVPGASARRTKGSNSTFERKYQKVYDLLSSDKQLISKIKSTAGRYGIDPIHMIGAIVGEHTYNVDAYDRLQSYYVKAASYAGNSFRFGYKDESIAQFLAHSQFSKCQSKRDSVSLWTCREDVWDDSFRGNKVEGVSYPDNRFSAVFFQPFYAGQTFGLGQINPLTALMLSDMVARVSGFEKLDENDAAAVYTAIMEPDHSLAYMAAAIRKSIDDYKSIADMDISKNPGLTSTLYNLGGSQQRAAALAQKNRQSGGSPVWPEENYYGWLVNEKLPELQKLL